MKAKYPVGTFVKLQKQFMYGKIQPFGMISKVTRDYYHVHWIVQGDQDLDEQEKRLSHWQIDDLNCNSFTVVK